MVTKNKKFHATLLPDQCYHIYNHAVGEEDLFKLPRNFAFFWQQWNKYITPYFVNYAYCLMPNHFHVLAKAKRITPEILKLIEKENTQKSRAFLAKTIPPNTFYESQFKRFFNSYTNAINKQETKRHGSLFKAKFKRKLIRTREDFLYYLQYIHHNPIHHDFTDDYLDWEYSSYAAYYDELDLEGISKNAALKLFVSEKDSSGRLGFIESHEIFKRDFRRGDFL
jgi:putative transposase